VSDTSFPLVSVIITTYGRSDTLYRAIESVLNQTYQNIQLIVVDDNIEDTLREYMNYNYPKALYLWDGVNRGGAGARQKGISHCCGEYVAFLDDDDYYYPNKIESLLEVFRLIKDADVVFGVVDRIGRMRTGNRLPGSMTANSINDISGNFLYLSYLHTNTSLIKKSTLETISFRITQKKYQDTQLHLEFLIFCNVLYLNTPVAVWNDCHVDGRITTMNTRISIFNSYKSFLDMVIYFLNKKDVPLRAKLYLVKKLTTYSISTLYRLVVK